MGRSLASVPDSLRLTATVRNTVGRCPSVNPRLPSLARDHAYIPVLISYCERVVVAYTSTRGTLASKLQAKEYDIGAVI